MHPILARQHTHNVKNGKSQFRVLRDKSSGESSDSAARHKSSATVIDFQATLKKDVAFWKELENDDVKIESCDTEEDLPNTSAQFSGSGIDEDDFIPGTVLSISRKEWIKNCEEPVLRRKGKVFKYLVLFLQVIEKKTIDGGNIEVHFR